MGKSLRLRIVFMIISFALLIFMASCSSSSEETSPSESGEDGNNKGEELKEIIVSFPYFSNEPDDFRLVEEEINKITEAEINTTVSFTPLSIGAYDQQMNLVLSGNEQLDLMVLLGGDYGPRVSRGQLTELDDLIENYGQGIKEALGDYFDIPRVDGKLYGVSSIRDLAINNGLVMRKDIVDEYNINVEEIKDLNDVEEVLKIVKENRPDMEPLTTFLLGSSILDGLGFVDRLGDGFGVIPEPRTSDSLEVVNYYATPEYLEHIEMFRRWYDAGYIVKDIATTQTSKEELIIADQAFAYFGPMKPGFEDQIRRDFEQDMVVAEINSPLATTTNVINIMWGIPHNAQEAEHAVKFLNLMYTDERIVNLINWGIEGMHYEKVSDNVITFPDGVTIENTGYNLNLGWMFGNQFLSYVWEGEDPEIWEKTDAFNNDAHKSPALGFNFDTSPVRTEYTAVANVVEQFALGLETGSIDPEKHYEDFLSRLEDAGINIIMEEKQRQLDEWNEANNN